MDFTDRDGLEDADEGDNGDEQAPPRLTSEELHARKERKKLQRLFHEVNTAVNCMKIVREIERICSELGQGLLVFAYRALLDDVLSSLMRVLDMQKERAFSLWKLDQQTVEAVCANRKIDFVQLRNFSARLRTARNKLQFHMDENHAEDPDRLWAELDIKYSEMSEVADNLSVIIGDILCVKHKFPANLSLYDASDVGPILETLHRAKLGNFKKRLD